MSKTWEDIMRKESYKELIAVCLQCKTSFTAQDANPEKWDICEICQQPFVVVGLEKEKTLRSDRAEK